MSQQHSSMCENDRDIQDQLDRVVSRPALGEQNLIALPSCSLPNRRRNHKDHTADEWEALRPRFTELYLFERRRLADVSRILRDERGFHATDKQFKDRIRKWGLRKNFKDEEKREALAMGVETRINKLTASQGAAIPRRRLKRFARDAKLLYVRHMAMLPTEPTRSFDIVLELPRSLFETGPINNARTLYAAFAAIDRLASQRTPILAFEVLGVSDTIVRYGLRRLEQKSIHGLAVEMIQPSETHGLGIRYCGALSALVSASMYPAEEETHIALYHMISLSLAKACQFIYCPKGNPTGQDVYQTRRTVYRPALNPYDHLPIPPGQSPEVRCVHYSVTAQLAKALYLRELAQSSLAGGIRVSPNLPDAEVFCTPHLGWGFCLHISPQKDFVLTLPEKLNVSMHIIKRGGLIAGAIQFRPGYEGDSVFMEGHWEQQVMVIQRLLTVMAGSKLSKALSMPEYSSGSVQNPDPGPFLTDGEAVEIEFMDASHRAAVRAAMSRPDAALPEAALLSRPMTAAESKTASGRAFSRLVADGTLVDRNELWKRAARAELSSSACR